MVWLKIGRHYHRLELVRLPVNKSQLWSSDIVTVRVLQLGRDVIVPQTVLLENLHL